MGKIKIKDIEIYAKHGAFAYEKKMRQKFLVTVEFDLNIESAAKTDDLNKTINYGEIVEICKKALSESRSLLETLVVSIAKKIDKKYQGISNLKVTIKKPEVQLNCKLDYVSVSHIIE